MWPSEDRADVSGMAEMAKLGTVVLQSRPGLVGAFFVER
jgi:hypothetical protein